MRKIAIAVTALIVIVAVAGFATLNLAPGFVVSTTQSIVASSAGLEKKTVELDRYDTNGRWHNVNYYQGGTGETVVANCPAGRHSCRM